MPLVDAFTSLDSGSPLVDWLEYVDYQGVPERVSKAMIVPKVAVSLNQELIMLDLFE